MTEITLKGNIIHTIGTLPTKGTSAPEFTLTKSDLSEASLESFKGNKLVLNIFPSLDTAVCALSVVKFNKEVSTLENVKVLCISADLPFAHSRFCESNNTKNVITLSSFRAPEFGHAYGATITDGPLKGLLSRAVVVIDEDGKVIYTEQVPEIAQEPNYDAVLKLITA
ncbi:thiol peroxidase [Candidatus Berkiella cookevillensis]|uniref:Thiol peroxidase n=1 Tax=Candidatus Berkiella cookevillensis TaxID=437022 RepID=A0A0Q9YNF6_9GAMM|nr:thiol peroxidase [Candidatus Berkiella cookevillensis]MCS5708119.1 thiol peroxidase [Candidatus Berkiella cookevillensis]